MVFWRTYNNYLYPLGLEKFNELWNYCKGHWSDRKIAEIEHDGYYEDGTPINPVVVGIREVSA